MEITLNKAMIDYFTCTTESEKIHKYWVDIVRGAHGLVWDRIKRYEGIRGKGDQNGIFVGESLGNAKHHYILQISGCKADDVRMFIDVNDIKSGKVNVTRIDVQATIQEPATWSQIGYLQACENAKLKPEAKRSRNPYNRKLELITVYTGTRTSGRYNRLYQKVTEDGVNLLRYETEFGRGYAKSVAYEILSGKQARESVIKGEVKRRKLECLRVFDLWQCELFAPKQERRIVLDNRANWLVVDILPVLAEYINRHDANEGVRKAFLQVLENSEVTNG
jgi:hypothetical protein